MNTRIEKCREKSHHRPGPAILMATFTSRPFTSNPLNSTNGFFSPTQEYPTATNLLLQHQTIILEELQALLQDHGGAGRKWGVWAAEDYDPPKFTLLTPAQILERQERVVEDPERAQQWSLFGLHLYKEPIPRGCQRCPRTAKILSQIPGLINAGFSCLGPRSETGWHDDVDRGFDRLHLSLVIPSGDCGFTVGSTTKRWKENKTIGFDDTFLHNAWNKTELARYVLLIDVERNSNRTEIMQLRADTENTKFYDWRLTFPCLEPILENTDQILREWTNVVDLPETIDSPETSYDNTHESWKNFWLVHSFPANVPELTTWMDKNCQLVPETAALLKQIPGIRDAFFSQLGPGVVLDEHYGYADQSNYVLRCHIPLAIPDRIPLEVGVEEQKEEKKKELKRRQETRPCYIEVEGQRQYHALNNAIVFDDSQLHSAGNLSSQQGRTVLIIDIDRPPHVNMGTSSSCISRPMLSHWSSKVYPQYNSQEIAQLVNERVPFCQSFLEEEGC
jgi:aspartyl/asparaginyl beta-hydroxylase (cupin superfamily)